MQPARIAELLAPFLSAEDATLRAPELYAHISTYIDILQRWNARVNLTAIRDSEEIVTRHFGESLFAARHLFPVVVPTLSETQSEAAPQSLQPGGAALPSGIQGGGELRSSAAESSAHPALADLGSGAGFPGIPIKLWVPDISLTLIESNHKKATFLREVTRALTLTDVNVQTARAETLSQTYDVVTVRAVEHFEQILPIAATLAGPLGRVALFIGSSQADQASSLLPALRWQPPLPVPKSRTRILLVGSRA